MIITQDRLDKLRTGFSLIFNAYYQSQLAKGDLLWQRLAQQVPSDSASNTYGWLAQQLTLRQWKGKRTALNMKEHVKELFNLPYEGTVEIDRDKIEDDKLGTYRDVQIPQLGVATAKHPEVLISALIEANPTTWDGKALFATDHPTFGKATTSYGNLFTSSALSQTTFVTAWAAMRNYKGEDDLPLGVMPSLLIVPPALKKTALDIVESTNIAQLVKNVAGTENVAAAAPTNTTKGWVEVVDWPYLTSSTTWYMADLTGVIKPFVYQVRRAPQFVSLVSPDSPKVFEERKFLFGVDYRGAVGETLPFLISKNTA